MTTQVIHEHEVITEYADKLECGVIRVNHGEDAVAYAGLGKTSISIFRDKHGVVRIEIDDIAEEPVHVSINTFTATATIDDTTDRPWNQEGEASEAHNNQRQWWGRLRRICTPRRLRRRAQGQEGA